MAVIKTAESIAQDKRIIGQRIPAFVRQVSAVYRPYILPYVVQDMSQLVYERFQAVMIDRFL